MASTPRSPTTWSWGRRSSPAPGLGFAAKIHGSALEYTVKPEPERFLPYAREGIDAASGVLVGSRHTAESLWAAIGDPEPARQDPPRPAGGGHRALLAARRDECAGRRRGWRSWPSQAMRRRSRAAAARSGPRPRAAADGDRWFAAAEGPRVVMVGKLIVSKGVDLLLAAWPLVHAANPGARLLVVGFGEYDGGASAALGVAGVAGTSPRPARSPRAAAALEGGEEKPLRMLGAFLARAGRRVRGGGARGGEAASRSRAGSSTTRSAAWCRPPTRWSFPSTFPEAFGMVAAEAAAAGVLPVSAAHSGAAEVSRALAASLPAEIASWSRSRSTTAAVRGIAERLNAWLRMDGARSRAGAPGAGGDGVASSGAGRGWRGACSLPRRAGWTSSRWFPTD